MELGGCGGEVAAVVAVVVLLGVFGTGDEARVM